MTRTTVPRRLASALLVVTGLRTRIGSETGTAITRIISPSNICTLSGTDQGPGRPTRRGRRARRPGRDRRAREGSAGTGTGR
ncbi:hypothetical protein GCM10010495_34130 [Kitasatospora herbaricolor]|nr:hypothetical protein [Kitasatospora herbaricolor]GGV16896.1 hypothetical protein GCM10010495_34130 [Kitasatospora herbaricolor]